jgi:hypothetical protein
VKSVLAGVVNVAIEEKEAVFVEREQDSRAEEFCVLRFGNVDGVALKFTCQATDFSGVEGFAELGAKVAAFFPEWDEDGFGVIIDELEVAGGGFELEVEEVVFGM